MPTLEDSINVAYGVPYFSPPILEKPRGDAPIDVDGSIALATSRGLPS
jgi:hypothetical protein